MAVTVVKELHGTEHIVFIARLDEEIGVASNFEAGVFGKIFV
jgi:hypothetical protein